jgi:ATP/maltotriose-dependent transcriptional regulator MalT
MSSNGYAKTTKPRTIGTVKRPRLFRLLDRGKRLPVTWVSGPPGSGKTLLVASYLASRKVRTVWYRLDESDVDLATLFQYLAWAVPKRGEALPMFTSEYQREFLIFSRNYFRKLFARLKAPFTLVFDDYQHAPADGPIHAVLGVAAAELPAGGRIFIVSRDDAPASFARLRAHQDLCQLGWSDLQFTVIEATDLAKGRLEKSVVRALSEMTNGWAAGLVLLINQSTEQRAASSLSDVRSPKLLFDYFAGEIFRRTAPQTQDFLMRTALLPSISVPDAQELTGRLDAGDLFLGLQRSNYFIQQQGGEAQTFRYHPLFRDFLLAQAEAHFSSGHLQGIRVKAAAVVESRGEHDMAAQLLLDGKCWEELSAFSLRNARTLSRQGRQHLIARWINQLPTALLTSQPWLLYWRGMATLASAPAACYADLECAFHLFRDRDDVAGAYLAWAFLVCAYHFDAKPCTLSDHWIPILEALMRERPFPTAEVEVLVVGAMICALAYRMPHPNKMASWLARWQELHTVTTDPAVRVYVHSFQMTYYTQVGEFSAARLVAIEGMKVGQRAQVAEGVTALAKITNAWYALYTASSADRRNVIDEAINYLRAIGLRNAQWYIVHCLGALAALSDDDLPAVQFYLEPLELDRETLDMGFGCWYESFMVRKALLSGNFTEARRHQPEMMRLAELCGSPRMQVPIYLLSAQVFHACGEEPEARRWLVRTYEMAEELSNPFFEFSARLMDVQFLLDNGEDSSGIAMLHRAMALGRTHQITHTHNWRRSVMAQLCLKALEVGIEVAYVRELIHLRDLAPDVASFESAIWPWAVTIHTLGTFSVLKNGEAMQWKGKTPRKPLALLKAVIALGGRHVREERLLDLLWPDLEGPQAHFALKTAVHRLRKLLGPEEIILRDQGTLSISPNHCWIDVWAIEYSIEKAAAVGKTHERSLASCAKLLDPAMALCAQEFLDDDKEVAWPTHYVDGLKRKLSRQVALMRAS